MLGFSPLSSTPLSGPLKQINFTASNGAIVVSGNSAGLYAGRSITPASTGSFVIAGNDATLTKQGVNYVLNTSPILYTDTFTGTSNTRLDVYNSNWVKVSAFGVNEDLVITANGKLAMFNAGNGYSPFYFTANTPTSPDYSVTATFAGTTIGSTPPAIGVHYDPATGAGYYLLYSGSQWYIFHRGNGFGEDSTQRSLTPIPRWTGDQMGSGEVTATLKASGNNLIAIINGVERFSIDMNSFSGTVHSNTGYPVVASLYSEAGPNKYIDNFVVGQSNIVVATTAPGSNAPAYTRVDRKIICNPHVFRIYGSTVQDPFTIVENPLSTNWTTVKGVTGLRNDGTGAYSTNTTVQIIGYKNSLKTFGADQSASIKVFNVNQPYTGFGVAVRASNTGGGECYNIEIYRDYNSGNDWRVYCNRFSGGVFAESVGVMFPALGNIGAVANNDIFTLEAIGTTLNVYQNGGLLGTFTNSNLSTAGQPGVIYAAAGTPLPRIVEFKASDITGTAGMQLARNVTASTGSITVSGVTSSAPIANDTFTGTDNTALHLHTPSSGGTWTTPIASGSLKIYGNVIKDVAVTATIGYISTQGSTADYDVIADVNANGAGNSFGVGGRFTTNTLTGYYVYWNTSTARWQLRKVISGSTTDLGSYAGDSPESITRNVKLELRGSNLKVYIDGVLRISDTDSSITAINRAAIKGDASGISGWLDNFELRDAAETKLKVGHSITPASAGAIVVTGIAASLLDGRKLTATTGRVNILRQPQGFTGIDYRNPLADGLVFAFNAGDPTKDQVTGNTFNVDYSSGVIISANTIDGEKYITAGGGSFGGRGWANVNISSNVYSFAVTTLDSGPRGNYRSFISAYTGTNNAVMIAGMRTAPDVLDFLAFETGGTHSDAVYNSAITDPNVVSTFVGTQSLGLISKVYQNAANSDPAYDVQVSGVGRTSATASFVITDDGNNNGTKATGEMRYATIWNGRSLSNAEVTSYTSNPAQIFKTTDLNVDRLLTCAAGSIKIGPNPLIIQTSDVVELYLPPNNQISQTLTGITANSTVVAWVGWRDSDPGTIVNSVSDGVVYSNTGPRISGSYPNNASSQLFYLPSSSSGDHTVIVTFSSTPAWSKLRLLEIGNAALANVINDAVGTYQTSTGTATDNVRSGTITTSEKNLIVGFSMHANNKIDTGISDSTTVSAGTGFSITPIANTSMAIESNTSSYLTTAGTYEATFTLGSTSPRINYTVGFRGTQSALLAKTYKLTTTTGSVVVTGNDATLTKGGASGYTLTADAGSIVITRNAVSILHGYKTIAATGSIVVTGNTASLLSAKKLTAAAGSIVVTRNPVFGGTRRTFASSGTIDNVPYPFSFAVFGTVEDDTDLSRLIGKGPNLYVNNRQGYLNSQRNSATTNPFAWSSDLTTTVAGGPAHWVVTYSAGQVVNLYKNGVAAATFFARATGSGGFVSDAGQDLIVYLNNMSHFAFANVELTSTDVTNLYNGGAGTNVYNVIPAGNILASSDPATLTLTASAGTVTITRNAANLYYNHILTAAAGTITITGVTATLKNTRTFLASVGSVTISGNAALFSHIYKVFGNAGTIIITGNAATLTKGGVSNNYVLVATQVIVNDSFTGTSNTKLDVYSNNWVKVPGFTNEDLVIGTNNIIMFNPSNGLQQYYYTGNTPSTAADYDVTATFTSDQFYHAGLWITGRANTTAGQFYALHYNGNAGWNFFHRGNGFGEAMGNAWVGDQLGSGPVTATLRFRGNTAIGIINGVERISANLLTTAGEVHNNGYAGVANYYSLNNSAVAIDDFIVTLKSIDINKNSANTLVGRVLSASVGSIVITRNDANLVKSGVYSLSAAPGSIVITLNAANLAKGVGSLTASTGTILLNGGILRRTQFGLYASKDTTNRYATIRATGTSPALPELPRAYVDTTYARPTGNVWYANTNTAFQSALNSAALNDRIVLQSGTIYFGGFTLPEKTTGNGWIYIESSNNDLLPVVNTRVWKSDSVNMPKVFVRGNDGAAAISVAQRAHHYRFVGIEIGAANTTDPSNNFVYNVISTGAGEKTDANSANCIIFDRCYVHGNLQANIADPDTNQRKAARRGFFLGGKNIAVVDSDVSYFFENGADSQAIFIYQGAGPFKVVNNYLEGASENLIPGGSDPQIPGSVPSDIEICRNWFYKPMAWVGKSLNVKNLLEFKNAQRVLIRGNVLQNNWADGQSGFGLLITPRNQDGSSPWCRTTDLTYQYNKILNTGAGLNVGGYDSNHGDSFGDDTRTARVLFEHNFMDVTQPPEQIVSADNRIIQFLSGPTDVTLRHNTLRMTSNIGNGAMYLAETSPGAAPSGGGSDPYGTGNQNKNARMHMKHNIWWSGDYGFIGTGTLGVTNVLARFHIDTDIHKNVTIGGSGFTYGGSFQHGNHIPVGFVDYANTNLRLANTSPYYKAAVDEKNIDIGANWAQLELETAGVTQRALIVTPLNVVITGNAAALTKSGNKILTASAGSYVVSGNAANLLNNHILTSAVGTIVVTRNAANLLHGYKTIANVGTIVITGNAANLSKSGGNLVLTAAAGSIIITRNSANLLNNRILTSAVGTIVVTRNAANLTAGRRITPAITGSIIITGNPANLLKGYNLTSAAGTIVSTRNAANLLVGRVLTPATKGTITVTGNQATLTKTGSYVLTCLNGTIIVSGQTANWTRTYRHTCSTGSIVISGQAVGLYVGRKLTPATKGTITVTGIAAGFLRGLRTIANTGNITINGVSTNLKHNTIFSCAAGTITITRNAAGTNRGYYVSAVNGTYTIVSNAAILTWNVHKTYTSTGTITLGGTADHYRGRDYQPSRTISVSGSASAISKSFNPAVYDKTFRFLGNSNRYGFKKLSINIQTNIILNNRNVRKNAIVLSKAKQSGILGSSKIVLNRYGRTQVTK